MKTQMWKWQTVAATVSIGTVLVAEAQPRDRIYLEESDSPFMRDNRVWGGGRVVFNLEADFSYGTGTAPGSFPGVGPENRTYDNGYVLIDDSGNVGGMTWNWGFWDLPGQPPTVNGTTLELSSTTSPAQGASSSQKDDPHFGFEVGYGRVLFRSTDEEGRGVLVGLDTAFNMTWLNIENSAAFAGDAITTVDSYDLSGLPIIPSAPYYGGTPTPGGPLPLLLPDTPFDRTTTTTPTTATEYGKLDGTLYGFNIGPFVEIPLNRAFALQVRGGFSAVLSDLEYKFSESLSTGGANSGSISDTDWLFGGYAELKLTIAVAPNVGIYVSGGFQYVGDHTLSVGGQSVKLDPGGVGTAGAGVTISF